MLKVIDNAIKKYILNIEALKTAYNEEKENIDKTYVKGSAFWNDLTNQLEEKHKATLNGLKENTRKVIEDTYKAINEKISNHISEPMPNGFYDTLKALERDFDMFSLDEVQAIADRYKSNYLATRSIGVILKKKAEASGQTTRLLSEIVELDVLKGELNNYKNTVDSIVDNYAGARTYTTDCFLMGDRDPSDNINKMLAEFLPVEA